MGRGTDRRARVDPHAQWTHLGAAVVGVVALAAPEQLGGGATAVEADEGGALLALALVLIGRGERLVGGAGVRVLVVADVVGSGGGGGGGGAGACCGSGAFVDASAAAGGGGSGHECSWPKNISTLSWLKNGGGC